MSQAVRMSTLLFTCDCTRTRVRLSAQKYLVTNLVDVDGDHTKDDFAACWTKAHGTRSRLRSQSMEAATGLLNSQSRKFVMAITARVLLQR